MADKIKEAKRIENENEVLAGIQAQADYSLSYVAEIVNRLVKDTTLAKQVIEEVTTKFNKQKSAFVQAVKDEFAENDTGDELTIDLTV